MGTCRKKKSKKKKARRKKRESEGAFHISDQKPFPPDNRAGKRGPQISLPEGKKSNKEKRGDTCYITELNWGGVSERGSTFSDSDNHL